MEARLTGNTIRALKANSNAQLTEDGKESGITDEKRRRVLDAIKYIDCGLNELPIVNNGREDYLWGSTVLGEKDNDSTSKIFVYQYAVRKIYNYEKRLITVIMVNLIADDTKQYIFQYEGNDIYYNRMVSTAKDYKNDTLSTIQKFIISSIYDHEIIHALNLLSQINMN
ncbi:unnamed protein product [Didymodactylos carnosus]|uniref:Uncharacterized protein n=1 Tax=Didymodactylos carnosus TaxID=1234261 RepID=A0A814WKY4_9BILA|nr:unnamed protein product [Didymodactylos carnosus]CAF3968073.1 unnamed protein product [Didymodactylos carnosus]